MSGNQDHSNIDKNLKIGIVLNTGFTIFEFIVGILSGSLALVSDSGHNLTDSLSLLVSFFARKIARRDADSKQTYGYGRITILAALINALILLLLAIYIFHEAYRRTIEPKTLEGSLIMVVAAVGIVVNLSIALLFRKSRDDLNIKSAFYNMALDALASVGALIAGLLILITKQPVFDSIISIVIGTMLIFSAWRVVKDAFHVLLEGVPEGVNFDKVKEAIISQNSLIKAVDDLHIWAISSQMSALSCHIVIEECDLDKSMQIVEEIKKILKERFQIEHATIETELVECLPDKNG